MARACGGAGWAFVTSCSLAVWLPGHALLCCCFCSTADANKGKQQPSSELHQQLPVPGQLFQEAVASVWVRMCKVGRGGGHRGDFSATPAVSWGPTPAQCIFDIERTTAVAQICLLLHPGLHLEKCSQEGEERDHVLPCVRLWLESCAGLPRA